VKDGQPSRDALKILGDFQADGRAAKVTTFADNLNIPIGVLPVADGEQRHRLQHSDLWRMSDTQGTGKADNAICYTANTASATRTA